MSIPVVKSEPYYVPQYQSEECGLWTSIPRSGSLQAAIKKADWMFSVIGCVTKVRVMSMDISKDSVDVKPVYIRVQSGRALITKMNPGWIGVVESGIA